MSQEKQEYNTMQKITGQHNTPTGMMDFDEKDIYIRNYIFDTVKKILKLRGATQIETPVAELYTTVESLYGDEFNKLVYTFDDDHQKIILRYDLTVPLSRYVGTNGLVKFRRFQYGKVYRKDTPQIQKGRLREFYQLDYDIIGTDCNSGINDLEMLESLNEILVSLLDKNKFIVKLNYKNIVINILTQCNIPSQLFKVVFSAIDKLDKKQWNEIVQELVEKNISNNSIELLGTIYNELSALDTFNAKKEYLAKNNILSDELLSQLDQLSLFIDNMKISNFTLDPFLIRGMDYYTGILFEVNYSDKSIMESTISAGGRYDNMIAAFSKHSNIPAIGMSLGIERIAKILEQTTLKNVSELITLTPDIYIASIGDNMLVHRVILCNEFRKLGYYTIMSDLPNPKMRSQFTTVFEGYLTPIPIMIVIGESEIKQNMLTVKDVNEKTQHFMNKQEVYQFLKNKLKK